MKVCATVLLGPGSESIVGDAIRSAIGAVDGFVLIESGGGDAAVAAAQFDASPKQAHCSAFGWTGSYSDARNAALDAATFLGYDWAVTLDPDERLVLLPDYRAQLEAHPAIDAWMIRDRDEGYAKERILRCRAGIRWHGRVCENIQTPTAIMGGYFWELPKSPDGHHARYARGVVECERMIADGDSRFKWWRHAGTCHAGLGNHEAAERCYREAYALAACPEDRALSAYLICELLVLRGEHERAHAMAASELAQHAGFLPEFGWIMAYVQFKRGELQNASRWCQLVVAMPPDKTRVGNRGKNCTKGAVALLNHIHGAEQ